MKTSRVPENSLLGVGLYTVSEAARVLSYAIGGKRVTNKKLRRWTHEYKYNYADVVRKSIPVVESTLKIDDAYIFTFEELIELLVIGAFRHENVSMRTIRRAHSAAKERFGGPHPFAKRRFDTDGAKIWATLTPEDVGRELKGETFTEEVERGQLALDTIVRPLFRKLTFDRGMAVEFWPLGSDHKVVLNPSRSFGKPIETTSGVPTTILHAASKSGESIEKIARWYRVPVAGVRDAIEYEAALRLAA